MIMSARSRLFVTGLIAVAVGLAGLLLRGRTVQVDLQEPSLAVGDERSVTLSVMWDGDVVQSERADCGVWTASWSCELRRGGDLGVVMSRTLPISATAAVDVAGTGQWGTENVLTWDTSGLGVGWYETFVRLEVTDGEETHYGYIDGEGQDGNFFYVADRFHVGQTCLFPLRIEVGK
jgi:hypothetical protein